MDFLLEALGEWEKRKGDNGIPKHNVNIPVTGGASAGGMTTTMLAAVNDSWMQHIDFNMINSENIDSQYRDSLFYHLWVDMKSENNYELLNNLFNDISNLKQSKSIISLINGNQIDQIAEGINDFRYRTRYDRIDRPYLDKNMKVFVTAANLKGIHQKFEGWDGFSEKIDLVSHDDYLCFKLNTTEYQNDGWIPLSFNEEKNTNLLIKSAKATGAFPGGLPASFITRNKQYLKDNEWINDSNDTKIEENDQYGTWMLDGGMFNRDPFGLVYKELSQNCDDRSLEKMEECPGCILMVDPLPSKPSFEKFSNKEEEPSLLKVLTGAYQLLRNQSTAKPENIINAMNESRKDQFIIAPESVNDKKSGKDVLAGSVLGAFGGFLSKEFRIHDYMVGRANCQKFLRETFTLPENHPLIQEGYSGMSSQQKSNFKNKSSGEFPIIPVFVEEEQKLPVFSNGTSRPTLKNEDFERFINDHLDVRLGGILDVSLKNLESDLNIIQSKLVSLLSNPLQERIRNFISNPIQEDLRDRGLLD